MRKPRFMKVIGNSLEATVPVSAGICAQETWFLSHAASEEAWGWPGLGQKQGGP